ncbi:MAG: hypothetical protein M3068_11370, partial [Gemmatimonadota bacterium]|nr:hypothetical protein [Gemmatimonadota bacterium]
MRDGFSAIARKSGPSVRARSAERLRLVGDRGSRRFHVGSVCGRLHRGNLLRGGLFCGGGDVGSLAPTPLGSGRLGDRRRSRGRDDGFAA